MKQSALSTHIAALLHSEAYPRPVEGVELIQTHISYVFLAGDRAFKVKKPVNFGFLDFTSIEKRRHFCEEEVRLNRRTCPDIYLGVVPVTKDGEEYRIGGRGDVIDYAVEMKRLPREWMMDELLAAGAVTPDMIGRLASVIADFHAQADTDERIRRAGGIETLEADWRENFDQTVPYVGTTIGAQRFERLQKYVASYLERERPLLLRREKEGRVRDCHGDLRSDSVCFEDERVCIFDCIEFNERFRCSDTGMDAAFLAMDLDFRGHRDLSDLFIGLYAALAGDDSLPLVLDFFKAYRAFVRGKVESLLLDEAEVPAGDRHAAGQRARAYFRLAESYARRRPLRDMVMVIGPSGTGKTTLAAPLAARLGLAYLSTDLLRRRGAGLSPEERAPAALNEGLYALEARERVYEVIALEAEAYLRAGRGMVLDGTFLTRQRRAPIAELARTYRRDLYVVECEAPEDAVRERQRRRPDEPWRTSDASWEVYLDQKARYEPADELPSRRRLVADTTAAFGVQLERVTRAFKLRR